MQADLKQALLKHDRMVPRYTSYPTAPHFQPCPDSIWLQERLANIRQGQYLSLYVHIPFCPQLCWFCGCNTRIVSQYAPITDYLALLTAELNMTAAALSEKNLRVTRLHFGGGSPTILTADDFLRMMDSLKNAFTFAPGAEIAIEIDPRNLTPDKAAAYARGGVNRVSFGIQDFDAQVMEAVNRPQSFVLDRQAIDTCRDNGIQSVNIDLMYGLPYQTVQTMDACASMALALKPSRIALFGYAHVPWMKKHMRLIPEDHLPQSADRLDLFETAAQSFENANYIPVGIDHFAREDDTLVAAMRGQCLRRNFQGYTDDDTDILIGLGTSAISAFGDSYKQNMTFMPQYRDRVAAGVMPIEKVCHLDRTDQLIARIINRMMCTLSVNPYTEAHQSGLSNYDFSASYTQLKELARDGLVLISPDGTIHALVRQAARLICACFDARLPPGGSGGSRHVTSI